MNPKISVLMGVYNGAAFLREAVDSILAQTFADFEFVIINDGSKDASGQILASYRDPRLKVFTIENVGLPAALNYGLERCRADLVMRMDADDIAYPHRFAALLEDWEKAGRPDVFGSGVDYIDEEGKKLWSFDMTLDDAAIRAAISAPNGKLVVMHPTVLLRKSAVLACGGYDPYFRIGQDNDLWLRMTTRYRFGNSPRRLLKYRFQPNSDTALAAHSKVNEQMLPNWLKLVSLQKKILIDAGDEELWHDRREAVLKALLQRVDLRTLQLEAVIPRYLTEAKLSYYGGSKVAGLRRAAGLLLRHPAIVLKRLTGREMTDLTRYLIDAAQLRKACAGGELPGTGAP